MHSIISNFLYLLIYLFPLWTEEVLLHWCSTLHPFKQKTCISTHRNSSPPTTHTPTLCTLWPPATPARALGAQPSAAHPAHLPPSEVPTFPTYAALALGKVAGALALALAKRGVKEHICSPDGARERERGEEGVEEKTLTNQGLDWSLLWSLHMASSLCVHTSVVATKVAPWNPRWATDASSEAARNEAGRGTHAGNERGGGGIVVVGNVTNISLFYPHSLFFCPSFPVCLFPLFKYCHGAFSATKGRKNECGTLILPPHHHPFYPST